MSDSSQASAKLEEVRRKTQIYFGDDYNVSASNENVIIVQSQDGGRVYVESEDLTVLDSIAKDYMLRITNWKMVAANGRMGLYCELGPRFSTRPFFAVED